MHERALAYMRWTNSHQENAKANYDTIVEPSEFMALMEKAVKAVR